MTDLYLNEVSRKGDSHGQSNELVAFEEHMVSIDMYNG